MMIYCVVIAGIWQTSGFVMAMFLAGLRGIDGEILKAAQIDGASTCHASIGGSSSRCMRPVFLSALHRARPHGDQVLRSRRRGDRQEARAASAELPSTFMYSYTFTRNQMAVGSASAVIMLMTIAAIMVPYLYSELREKAMSAADLHRRDAGAPVQTSTASSSTALLMLFAMFYLMPLVVMVMTSFKPLDEVRGGNMLALPHALDLRAVDRRPGATACIGADLRRHQGLFLELDQDGRSGGADLDPARRAQRLCADQMALPRPQARVRHDAVRLLHSVPVGPHSDGDDPRQARRSAMLQNDGTSARQSTSIWLVHVVYGLGFTTLFFRNYYEAFPTELVKAAQIDGAGFFQIFRRILLPNSPPIFIVTVIYQFTNIWNDFLFGSTFAGGRFERR